MSRFTLYTYETVDEFNKLYGELEEKGKKIHPFIFEETQELLEEESNVIIDISALVELLKFNPSNKYAAILNFNDLDNTSKVIIKSELANQAMEYFCTIFGNIKPLPKKKYSTDNENSSITLKRRVLYTYENGSQLENIINFADKNEITFANFSKLNANSNNFKSIIDEKKKVIMDITSITIDIIRKLASIYLVEQKLESFPHFDIVIREDIVDEALDLFRHFFRSKKSVSELLSDISLSSNGSKKLYKEKVIRVTDLSPTELNEFHRSFSSQLFGHNRFKEQFQEHIDNFIIENSIDTKKIFSVFLLGNSGVGKTEVARIIKRALNDDAPLVKINFGNYSSKDVLNSLIGSPRGYQGMEEGELSVKINKSKAGIILCDEIEKATYQIFNFFLELLEDGVFTDSMSREYNLDGYIIIFTSNINGTLFDENIPPEFQSRLDIVSEFDPLTKQEKIDYVDYQIQIFIEKLKINTDLPEFSESDINYFKEMNLDYTENLRDIKRDIRERMLDRLKKLKKSDLKKNTKKHLEDTSKELKIDKLNHSIKI